MAFDIFYQMHDKRKTTWGASGRVLNQVRGMLASECKLTHLPAERHLEAHLRASLPPSVTWRLLGPVYPLVVIFIIGGGGQGPLAGC